MASRSFDGLGTKKSYGGSNEPLFLLGAILQLLQEIRLGNVLDAMSEEGREKRGARVAGGGTKVLLKRLSIAVYSCAHV